MKIRSIGILNEYIEELDEFLLWVTITMALNFSSHRINENAKIHWLLSLENVMRSDEKK